ncbi:MAG: hypothetical protein JXA49_01740, partial [Actinobacteria bacterium]|nr:hypothetical protein [Actinomycetota bacterium]
MPDAESGFRNCYRHPRRVAIRDCACCGRPICRECEEESKDDLLCLPCKQELKSLEEEHKEPVVEEGYRIGHDRARLNLGDMTVFDDGTVVVPPSVAPEKGSEDAEAHQAEEEGFPAEGVDETEVVGERAVEVAPPEGAAEAGAGGGEENVGPDTPAGVESGALDYEEPWLRLRKPVEVPGGDAERAGAEEVEIEPGGPVRQLLIALSYSLLAAGALTGLWLIIAFISRQWSQASVFSMGIVVPWVLYKGSLVKKRFGRRVWREPPPAMMMSITSAGIMAVIVPFMEYFAFKIISSSEALLPFSDFMQRYFKPTGWML